MDGAPPGDEDWSKLPVEERLNNKNWKARVSAYTELQTTFRTSVSEDAPEFAPYTRNPALLRAAILDSNAVAQEHGLLCACSFVEHGGKNAATRSLEPFTTAIVEKNIFGTARAASKKAVVELCLLLVECSNSADTVFEACAEALKSKQPKAVAGAVTAIKEIVRQFGAKTVNVKPVLKLIPVIFAHPDKTVRAEGTLLVQELHRWLGAALDPHLTELKPVQIKELSESFAGEEKPIQTRFTRTQQRERALREAEASLTANGAEEAEGANLEGNASDGQDGEEQGLDAYDLAEPQNILARMPEGFYENISSAKWKERKELALDPLLETLKKSPRIQDASYDELVRALAAKMADANIACVTSAAGCLQHLAAGLRLHFARYKSIALSPILERCKEKKQSVTDALASALDAIFASVTITDIVEDIVAFSKHKNPQVKEQTYKFVNRALSTTKTAPSLKTDFKPLVDALLAGMDDSFGPVRDAAAEGLGTLHKMMGERPMTATMEALDDIKRKKVLDFAAKAQIRYRPSAAGHSMPPTAKPAPLGQTRSQPSKKTPAAPQSPVGSDKENRMPSETAAKAGLLPPSSGKPLLSETKPPLRKPPILSSMKKPATPPAPVASTSKVMSAPPKGAAAPKAASAEPLKYRYNQEDAEAQGEAVLPAAIFVDLGNANWKLRLAAMESLQAWFETDSQAAEAELVVRTLSKKPGWKESNFQVFGKMAAFFQWAAENLSTWTRACTALVVGPLSDKLGDVKLKKPCGDALTAFAEKYSLQFVLHHAYDAMSKQKAPKAQADSLTWTETALREFGVLGLAARDFIEFLKIGLKSSNASVRANATKTLVTLRLFLGQDIKTFIQDLNSTLMNTIEQEFDKTANEPVPVPTRVSADHTQSASVNGSNDAATKAAADELFPRQDIAKLVPGSIVKSINDANWKQRKEALEQIQGILEANKRLKPNLGDMGPPLKARLGESNKVVQTLALDVIGRIASGMNKAFDKSAKTFLAPMCAILADAKATVRGPALATLTVIHNECGLDCMLSSLAAALETSNPIQRQEMATWLATSLSGGTSSDLSPLIAPAISCLEDKSPEVRKAAQRLLPFVVANTGVQRVMDHASVLRPASRSVVMPLIDAARTSAESLRPSSALESIASSAVVKTSSTASAAGSNGKIPLVDEAGPSRPASRTLPLAGRPLKPVPGLPLPPSADRISSTEPQSGPASARKPTLQRPLAAVSPLASPRKAEAAQPKEGDGPFLSGSDKAKQSRSARETGPLKWAIEGSARQDQLDYLQQQMTPYASSAFTSLAFSKDHHAERDYASALDMLVVAADQCRDTTVGDRIEPSDKSSLLFANADLVLKYVSVRLADATTTSSLKALEVLQALFGVVLNINQHLSDYEAAIILPSLVQKLGDGKEAIRIRVRTLLRTMGSIYPSSKVFSTLLDIGGKAKNARVRVETAEELGSLIHRHGLVVCQPSKALREIASLISDRDPACRSAALDALAEAYALAGNDIFGYVGELPAKENTMLEERLQRTATAMQEGSGAQQQEKAAPTTPSRASSRQSLSRPGSRNGTIKPGSSRLPAAAGSSRRASALPGPISHLRQSQLADTHKAAFKDTDAVYAVDHLNNPSIQLEHPTTPSVVYAAIVTRDVSESVNALKVVQKRLHQPQDVVESANELIDAITAQMAFAFERLDATTPQGTLRLCKHLMQTLSAFFDDRNLSIAVRRDSLVKLLAELTKRLLETADSGASEAITSLSKVLNMVLIRIFHNSDSSSCFGSLFILLKNATLNLRELEDVALTRQAKYAELIMKCLWKISKSVKESLEDQTLDPRQVLLDIDRFLQVIPPAEWRRRASDSVPLGDMPLRTIKTILQQVVATYAETVYDQLTLIDRPESSFVYQYLYRLLNNARSIPTASSGSRPLSTHSAVEVKPSARNESYAGAGPAGPASASMSPGRSADIETNLALKDIFDKIGNAQESKIGIAELYAFQKEHPEAQARVNTWIAQTGSFFQSYLRRALSNLAIEDNEKTAAANGNDTAAATSSTSVISPPISSERASGGPKHNVTSPSQRLEGIDAATDRTSSPRSSARMSMAGSAQYDEKLDTLKQMFGIHGRPLSPREVGT